MEVKINPQWKKVLREEFDKEYFKSLSNFLHTEKAQNKIIYPKGSEIFNAFELTPFNKVKVVILGQDPYHGPGQAHGLSFSVPHGIRIPPSLINIYKEISSDLGHPEFPGGRDGNLIGWAKQGVFLLNASLTVQAGIAASHSRIGWEFFTDAVIKQLSDKREHIVFMLWGNFARAKRDLIDSSKHLVLEAAHPSPLARGAFFGCKHFSKCNDYLCAHGIEPINWLETE